MSTPSDEQAEAAFEIWNEGTEDHPDVTNNKQPPTSINEILDMVRKRAVHEVHPEAKLILNGTVYKDEATALYTLIAESMPKLANSDNQLIVQWQAGYNKALVEVKDIIEGIFNV